MSVAVESLFALVLLVTASAGIGLGLISLVGRRVPRGLAPVIGLAAIVWLACAGLFPGLPAWFVGAAIGVAAALGVVVAVRRGSLRPPTRGSVIAYGVAAAITFGIALTAPLVERRVGIPGVALNNDLANHLKQIEFYINPDAFPGTPIWEWYPTGGHAVAAVVAAPLGLDPVATTNALLWATILVTAWVGVAALRRLRMAARILGASLVGVPYLVAGYVGQGAFKEPLVGAFLAAAIVLIVQRPRGLREYVVWPFVALMGVSSVLVYSYVGAAWIAATVAAVVVLAVARAVLVGPWAHVRDRLRQVARGAMAPVVALVAATLLLALPFASNIWLTSRGTDAGVLDEAGNLVGPLSPLQWLGVWPSYDFRVGGFLIGDPAYIVAVVGLVMVAAITGLVMKRALTYLSALGVGIALYAYLAQSSSWYFTAKGLVVLAPLVMICVFVGLHTVWTSQALPGFVRVGTMALASVFGVMALASSVIVFAGSPVGPMEHVDELRSLRPELQGKSVLFMGDDDFVDWELAGATVFPVLDGNRTGLPPADIWNTGRIASAGAPIDLDYLKPSFLDRFDAIVSPAGAAVSGPPPGSVVLARTPHYVVWRLPERVPDRLVAPDNGISPVGIAVCTPELTARPQVVARRADAVFVPAPGELPPGESAEITMGLEPGLWDLAVQYYSPNAVTVQAGGRTFTLPPLLLRPTPFWPVGRIRVTTKAPTRVRFTVHAMRPFSSTMSPLTKKTRFGQMGAFRDGGISRGARAGCGSSVDWIYAAG